MKGTPHKVDAMGDGTVLLYNIDDSYYHCHFETREEVDKFISKLAKARDKIFGKEVVMDFNEICQNPLGPYDKNGTNFMLVKDNK